MSKLGFLTAALVLAAMAAPAAAQRPDTRGFACGAIWPFIQANGAVVMTTGPRTYDRIVASRRYCQPDEVLQRHFGQAADNPRCFVGYVCRQPIRPFHLFDRD